MQRDRRSLRSRESRVRVFILRDPEGGAPRDQSRDQSDHGDRKHHNGQARRQAGARARVYGGLEFPDPERVPLMIEMCGSDPQKKGRSIENVPAPEDPSLEDWKETRLAVIKLAISQLPKAERIIFTALFVREKPQIEVCALTGLSRFQLRRAVKRTCKDLEKSPLLKALIPPQSTKKD